MAHARRQRQHSIKSPAGRHIAARLRHRRRGLRHQRRTRVMGQGGSGGTAGSSSQTGGTTELHAAGSRTAGRATLAILASPEIATLEAAAVGGTVSDAVTGARAVNEVAMADATTGASRAALDAAEATVSSRAVTRHGPARRTRAATLAAGLVIAQRIARRARHATAAAASDTLQHSAIVLARSAPGAARRLIKRRHAQCASARTVAGRATRASRAVG
jgi:hypothetical protein